MITPEIHVLLERAEDSHRAAKVLLDRGFSNFSAAQSYYTMFYLTEALLYSKGLQFSSHSAVMATYGKEFAKLRRLTRSFIGGLLLLNNAARQGITPGKTA